MRVVAQLLLFVALACVAAFVIALGHPGGSLRLTGLGGTVLSSDTVRWAAPVTFIVSLYVRRRLRRSVHRR
ncbi:MAG: hypothetical protein ACLQVK_20475 [Acidimicrobiales bacterium]